MLKKIAGILLLILAGLPITVFAFDLPDYKKEAKLTLRMVCDQKTTKVEIYTSDKYDLGVISVKSGKIFYAYADFAANTERLFIKTANSGKLEELDGEKWDAALKLEGANLFNRMSGKPSDCEPLIN